MELIAQLASEVNRELTPQEIRLVANMAQKMGPDLSAGEIQMISKIRWQLRVLCPRMSPRSTARLTRRAAVDELESSAASGARCHRSSSDTPVHRASTASL